MITAESERNHVVETINSGVSDLLIKPYTADSLARHIIKTLTWHSRTESADPSPLATRLQVPAIEEVSRDAMRPSILVVDDSADNLQLLSYIFKEQYQVRIANSGKKALAICQSNNPPDLVLLDIMMPDMDGFEVAKLMREHSTSETIPVIFVTSMTGDFERHKCMELGAIDFVTKPIDPDMIKLRVHNFMRYVMLNKQLQINYDYMLELARLRENVEHITRHDMKGPLAGVIGMVQALTYDITLNTEQIRQLHKTEDTAFDVLDMINLSSEIFKIETGRFKLDAKPVMISSILHRIAEISRTTFANKNIIVELDTDMPSSSHALKAMGDATLCYSLFQNLIKNACEAAPEASHVSITMLDEDPLHIVIRNKGVVPAEIRERFFDKFVTLGKPGGTGLGTYSAKALAVAQNGNVDMEVSDVENHTTITVTLPRYTEEFAQS
jgi:CheY-like chemotaxis protein